jgi:hypothetical protein
MVWHEYCFKAGHALFGSTHLAAQFFIEVDQKMIRQAP